MKYIGYVFWLVVILIAIVFASLNSHTIILDYYFGKVSLYFPLLILIGLVIGAVLGMFAMMAWVIKIKGANRKLRQRIKRTEQEVKNLRTIPIKDTH